MLIAFDEKVLLWEWEMLHNPLWRWLALLGVLLVTLVVGRIVRFVLEKQGKRLETVEHMTALRTLFMAMSKPAALAIFAGGLYFAQAGLGLTLDVKQVAAGDGTTVTVADPSGPIRAFWLQFCEALAALALAWFIYRLVDVLEHFLAKWTSRTHTKLDDQLVPLLRKTLRVFIVIVAGLFIAQNVFQWEVGSLLAGLGIGGLAFALAAQDSLSNLFGSIVIFADRPFQMGERIVVQGHDGMVEEVGFRSTKIRTLMGHLVTIPNSVVANEAVENIGRRPSIKRVLNVTVTYDTAPAKVQRAVDILNEMLEVRKASFPVDFPPRVYFSDFNADSLNIIVYYWFTPADWWEYMEFNHGFNMELLSRYNEEGIEFAFPTQTLYLRGEGEFAAAIRNVATQGADPTG